MKLNFTIHLSRFLMGKWLNFKASICEWRVKNRVEKLKGEDARNLPHS